MHLFQGGDEINIQKVHNKRFAQMIINVVVIIMSFFLVINDNICILITNSENVQF